MTIYINGRFLTQPMTGVERYAYNICKAMARLHQPFTLLCPKEQWCSGDEDCIRRLRDALGAENVVMKQKG